LHLHIGVRLTVLGCNSGARCSLDFCARFLTCIIAWRLRTLQARHNPRFVFNPLHPQPSQVLRIELVMCLLASAIFEPRMFGLVRAALVLKHLARLDYYSGINALVDGPPVLHRFDLRRRGVLAFGVGSYSLNADGFWRSDQVQRYVPQCFGP